MTPSSSRHSNIKDDKGHGTAANPGKRNDFEKAVAYLLPKDPVARKIAKGPNKRGVSKISDLNSSNGNDGNGNLEKGIGKTGVHLCWHSAKSFRQLTTEQKKELMEWRKNNKNDPTAQNPKKEGGSKKKKTRKDKIAAAVEKKFAEKLKEDEQKKNDDKEAKAYIMGLLNLDGSSNKGNNKNKIVNPKPSTISSSDTGTKVTLQGIIKNAKNQY